MRMAELLHRARSGDPAAREEFIACNSEFIRQTASRVCGRHLDRHQDETSIALIAFNEAIDTYNETKGVPFLVYARLVIRSRLTDHFRREARFAHTLTEDEASINAAAIAGESVTHRLLQEEKRREMIAYREHLAEFGLTLGDLVAVSPKHRDTRRNLLQAARKLASEKELFAALLARKKIPLSDLAAASGVSAKILARGRKYIIAVSLIFGFPDRYPYLYSYLTEC